MRTMKITKEKRNFDEIFCFRGRDYRNECGAGGNIQYKFRFQREFVLSPGILRM